MYQTNEFRKGLKIEQDGKPFVILDFQHVNPGKGAAFTRTKIRNLETGQVLEVTFKSGEKVNSADLQYKDMQYLYSNGETYTFMDMETYDQVELTEKDVADTKNYIIENAIVESYFL